MSRPSAGFTLIEAMIAAGLLVTAALGTVQLFALATAQNAVARHQLIMTGLAAAKLDDLAAGPLFTGDGAETIVESGRAYARRWHVTEVPGYSMAAWAMTVIVTPVTGAGGEVRLTTIRVAGAP